MINTGVSAVLGLGYWVVAARHYSEEAVGQGSAAIAAMKFLAGLTAVTLIGALARFVPVAGRTTRRLIVRTYLASSAVVGVAALAFLLTLDHWGPSYGLLRGLLPGFGFLLAVLGWSLLTLQDGVLTGLRSATWVPVGNTVFSTGKLALLVLLAPAVPMAGVFVSWAAAIALSVLPLGWLVFRRLIPRHVNATARDARPAGHREMGRFLAGDYTGSLFSLAVVYLVPVIVAARVGAADNAYFYVTITISGTVNLLALNMGSSLTVEGAHNPARLAADCRAALRRMARIMLPVCGALFVLAPYVLGVFGPGYAEAATPLLRCYAVGALLRVVIEVYFAVLRVRSRTAPLAALQGLLCLLVLGLTVLLLPRLGLTGAGVAELASLGLVAAIAAWRLRKVFRNPAPVPRGAVPAPDGDLADLATDGVVRRRRRLLPRRRSRPGRQSAPDVPESPEPPEPPEQTASHDGTAPAPTGNPAPPEPPAPNTTPPDTTPPDTTVRGPAVGEGRPERTAPEPPRAEATAQGTSGTGPTPPGVPRVGGRTDTDTGTGTGVRGDAPPPERTAPAAPGTGAPETAAPGGRGEPEGGARKRVSWPRLEPPPFLGRPLPPPHVTGTAAGTAAGTGQRVAPAAPVDGGGGAPGAGSPAGLGAGAPDGRGAPSGATPSWEVPAAEPPPRAREFTEPAGRGPARAGALFTWVLLAVGLALYWLPLRRTGEADLADLGGLGLVTALPVPTLCGGALLVCAFAAGLGARRQRRLLLGAVLLATVVSLHAVPAVLENEPRFPTAWQHLGFLDYVDRTGTSAPELDARWSWPGFFAGAAFVARACGVDDPTAMLRWWPTVLQLACLAPMVVLLRGIRAGWRAKWCALWFFALSGWVGQDYFSPQSFTYLCYLLFAALLLGWFRARGTARGGRLPGEADPPGEPGRDQRAVRAVLLAVLLVLFAASVAGHQLTPFVMLGTATGLVLARRATPCGLPLLCGVVVTTWVCFLAEPYWSGHLNELFGGFGGVGGNVSSSVAGRIEGGSETHQLVLYARVGLAAGLLALAVLGVLRRRRAGLSDRALVVLAGVPFLAFAAQSYGGEIALRVFLFAAPGLSVLAALALFPSVGRELAGGAGAGGTDRPGGPGQAGRRWTRFLAAALAGAVLFGGFLVARWGNESFERVRPGEVAAMEFLYARDQPTLRVLWPSHDPVNSVTPAMPWGARDMERVEYLPTPAPPRPSDAGDLVRSLREAGPHAYLLLGEGQSRYLQLDAGYPPGWSRRVRATLDERPELRRVFGGRDAAVYQLRATADAAREAPPPDPGPPGPRVTWTVWSLAGALAAVVLTVLLAAREVVRVAGRPGARRATWLRDTFWCALPFALLFAATVVHRFVTLA
ncbi:lipopolysaccharide biosynthesis protein [Streptomyces sp. AJS327]|uniref:polysaccharide biosynthesis C-terminal domain-containing protein n=1 Tax=Streptomyces sp. AJS327 TaxID=2545265 RepID=UPI0015DE618E|nr:polysaccharide biosynthesis C-terminal domain-containing protein [Streptomyces sp. AJS327]MBA0050586.1 lipopolysaccharide biosynthesis protein [Streptomyces sp. AJS327]